MDENNIFDFDLPVNGTDNREACSRFWIAVNTRSQCEKNCNFLIKLGI